MLQTQDQKQGLSWACHLPYTARMQNAATGFKRRTSMSTSFAAQSKNVSDAAKPGAAAKKKHHRVTDTNKSARVDAWQSISQIPGLPALCDLRKRINNLKYALLSVNILCRVTVFTFVLSRASIESEM